jgi:GNAT superfamily N-acetyltransferase
MEGSTPNIISKVPTQEEIQFLEDRIYEYNAAAIKRDDGKLFSKLIHDTENNVIAGISGWTWANACEITLLWVQETHRNKGYGQSLLYSAEAEAKKERCKMLMIRTYSFQAPRFYMKYGYEIGHETTDFPYGHTYFCLFKKLAE